MQKSLAIALFSGLALLASCSNKEDDADTNAPAKSAAQIKEESRPLPVLKEADEALKKKEYDQAAAMLVQANALQAAMSEEQAAQVRNSMRNLQQSLVEAAGRGDPKAIQAIQLLRASSSGGPLSGR